ncbi:MAG: SDR family NAD(P)-dependent oxidoreductase [Sandaracinaceae bacterium]|nr:SDR family NAD(P)-dependent oxidoreductase [Sandaracinaceae bacterium]
MTWILITGASRGIGRASALRLAAAGARVIATGRDVEALGALEREARARGGALTTLRLDVDDARSVEAAAAAVHERTAGYGLDVLVNNAGFGEMTPIVRCGAGRERRMFETNLVGAARCVRAFLPAMRARGRGRIVNVASLLGRMVMPLQGVYAAAKHALEAMNDALRLEVERFGVEVLLLEPGAVDTPFNDVAFRALDALAADPDYGAAVRRMQRIEAMYRRSAAPPEALAEALERLCLGPSPSARTTAPGFAHAQLEAMRASPRGLREGVLRAALALGPEEDRPPAAPSRRALVTGAAGGIGKEACFALARAGWRVVATDMSPEGLAALGARAKEQRLAIETRVMDVTDERSIASVADGLALDVLVNNAGYAEVAPIELATDAAWHDQLAVNVHGMSSVTRAFAPAMMARRRGHVINVSSVVGRVTFPFLGVYGASKHAVEALTDGLRLELGGFGVRVSAIQPAFIRTGFAARAKASLARYDVSSGPYERAFTQMDRILDRLDKLGGEPPDVARAIVRAARSASPRARQQTPWSAWLAVRTVPWLPVSVVDAGMARFMGMRRE